MCIDFLADIGVIFDKLDTIGHVLLSNEMGLGKTKVFALAVECMARHIEAKAQPGEKVYFPTLVLNPVPTIHQTHAEFRRNFPGLNVVLYYSSKTQSRKFGGAKVLEKGEFIRFLRSLDPTNPAVCLALVLASIALTCVNSLDGRLF